ncbi:MAG: EamA family transporter, partial [Burkholderiaceae bacterium]
MKHQGKSSLIEAGMPLLFVLIWSTGFIVAKFGLPYAPTLTFLSLRYIGVLLVLIPSLVLLRAPWPQGSVLHIATAGVLVQAGYLSGVWCAIKLGMPAGLAALIVGLQPLLTGLAAGLVGEPVRLRQWLGLLLGLAGVLLVVANKLSFVGVTVQSVSLCVMALFSITAGTLYQKRFCPQFDLRVGAAIQFSASLLVTLPLAIFLEHLRPAFDTVQWT